MDMQQVRTSGDSTLFLRNSSLLIAAILLVNSVLRGIRAPSLYVYTEMLQNYDFGFSKRALIGAIISLAHIPSLYHYSFCFWFSATLLVMNLALLMNLLRRLYAVRHPRQRLCTFVFASSLAVVMLAHTIGYGEHIGLLITLLTLHIKNYSARLIFVSILLPFSILCHETNFVLFFPVILFTFLLDIETSFQRTMVFALSFLLVCAVGTLSIVDHTRLSIPSAMALYQQLQLKADYPLRLGNITSITATSWDIARINFDYFWNQPGFKWTVVDCLAVTLPTTLYLVTCSLKTLISRGRSYKLLWSAAIASLAPLLLHIVAWDTERWTTLATTTSFLVFAISTLSGRPVLSEGSDLSRSYLAWPLVLVVMNLGSTITLEDGYIVQSFPYHEHVDDLVKTLKGQTSFPPPPALCEESGCVTTISPWTGSKSAVARKDLPKTPWP